MATKDFEANLTQELNLWAVRVFTRIRRKFIDYFINRHPDEEHGYTGDLYRKMWWTVHEAAGGNKAMITFFYLKYGDFVQWGVGGKVKKWPVPQSSSGLTNSNNTQNLSEYERKRRTYTGYGAYSRTVPYRPHSGDCLLRGRTAEVLDDGLP